MGRSKHLLIRADASSELGIGHVMRCLALAQAWLDDGGDVTLGCIELPEMLRPRLATEGVEAVSIVTDRGSDRDAAAVCEMAERLDVGAVVVDGYCFDSAYLESIYGRVPYLLVVDDFAHQLGYSAHAVLDQNLGADEALYAVRAPTAHLMLGPRHALLRRELRQRWTRPRECPRRARHVLLSLGGADVGGHTVGFLAALDRVHADDLEFAVLVGPACRESDRIAAAAASLDHKAKVVSDVRDVAPWLEWSDVAVAAAGSTVWELAYAGVPSILVGTCENQCPVLQAANRAGIALSVGRAGETSPDRLAGLVEALVHDPVQRQALSDAAMDVVDGHGATRVAAVLRGDDDRLIIRRALAGDAHRFWAWRNDAATRESAFDTRMIPWPQHEAWFRGRLRDPSCVLMVVEDLGGDPVGHVRFDLDRQGSAEIDVIVAPHRRGERLGARVIATGVEELTCVAGNRSVNAHIRTGNHRSIRAFERAGFRPAGSTSVGGVPALHFVHGD